MTTLREAAQQALEAMHVVLKDDYRLPYEKIVAATDALNVALAEPVLQTCNCRWDGEVQVQQCTLHEAHVDAIHEWAERAKFAEKKLAALAEPVQEPVAWMDIDSDGNRLTVRQWSDGNREEVPLYTAPPQRKPLTEEEIDELAMDKDGLPNSHIEFARAIERAHGITGDKHGS